MSVIWMDGFDHYGSSYSNLLLGRYASLGYYFPSLPTLNPATGTRSLRFTAWNTGNSGSNDCGVRGVLPAPISTIGVGFNLRLDALPTSDDQATVFHWRTSANGTILVLGIQSDGTLTIRAGSYNGTILGDSGINKISAGGYNHIESKIFHDPDNGTIELRVNEITWIDLSGVDTGSDPSGQFFIGSKGGGGTFASYYPANIDDFFIWDTTGDSNNDFQGIKSVMLSPPDQDETAADWTSTESTGFAAIDDDSPDGDSSYISASALDQISEFGLTDLPSRVTAISAVMLFKFAKKTDSGAGNVQASLVGSSAAAQGADDPMTTAYQYFDDIIELNPDTGAAITPTEFNAMKLRLERTA